LVANFRLNTLDIHLTASPPEGGEVKGGGIDLEYEKDITIEAKPSERYDFIRWTEGDWSSDINPFTFPVTRSRDIVAVFDLKIFNITIASDPPGGGVLSGDGYFSFGTIDTVCAVAKENFTFINWMEDGKVASVDNIFSFPVNRSRHLIANFKENYCNVTVAANPTKGGTVEGGEENIPNGTTITVKANAIPEYSFINWTDGDSVACETPEYRFEVTRSRHLTANFSPNMYKITVIADPPDFGEVSGEGEFPYEEEITVFATPNIGCNFVYWMEEDTVVSTNEAYTFIITGSRILTANFDVPRLDFDTYAVTLWNNTFMLNLKKLEEEYGKITGCKWFKNDIELKITNTIDQFSYSAGSKKGDLLEIAPTYYSFLITTGSGLRYSTKKVLTNINPAPTKNQLLVYPNPAWSGSAFTIERLTKDTYIEVYNQYGVCLSRTIATDEIATLSLDLPSGVYFIRNNHKEAKVVIIR
jgi:hypothetical protein